MPNKIKVLYSYILLFVIIFIFILIIIFHKLKDKVEKSANCPNYLLDKSFSGVCILS